VRTGKDTGGKFFRKGFWGSTFLALSVASGFVDSKRGGSDGISGAAASELGRFGIVQRRERISDGTQLVMSYVPLAGTKGVLFFCYFVGLTLAFGIAGAFGRVRMVVGASLTGRGFCGG
jgi:hypothetical protein